LISIDQDFRLLVGEALHKEASRRAFAEANFLAYEGRRVTFPEWFAPDPEFLRYHRERIFEAA
jgi:putative restriction endonuclease